MDIDASRAPSLLADVRTFFPERAPMLAAAAMPQFQSSARFAPLPAYVHSFRRQTDNAEAPLRVQVSNELASLDPASQSAPAQSPPIARSARTMDTISPIQAFITARNNVVLLRLPFPSSKGVLALSDVKPLWQKLIEKDNAYATSHAVSSTDDSSWSTFLAAESALAQAVQAHFTKPGAVRGYRHLPTTAADYAALMSRHTHSIVADHADMRKFASEWSHSLAHECKMPLPSVFGYRHNNIIPLLEMFAYSNTSNRADKVMTSFFRTTSVICLQYYAFANARFFERDPTQVDDFAPSSPPFLLLINGRDWWKRGPMLVRRQDKSEKMTPEDAAMPWRSIGQWMGAVVCEENVEQMAKELPFVVFYYKAVKGMIDELPLLSKDMKESMRVQLLNFVLNRMHQNITAFMQTTRFMAADIGEAMVAGAAAVLDNSELHIQDYRKPVACWTKCYISNRFLTTNLQQNGDDKSLVGRVLPTFYYHASFSPYAPIIEESVEDYAVARLCKSILAPNSERLAAQYFPLYSTQELEQAQAQREGFGNADIRQVVSMHVELQNRYLARISCFLVKDLLKDIAPILNTEWSALRNVIKGTNKSSTVRSRMSFIFTSHDVLLPTITHEWSGSFLSERSTLTHLADATDYEVVLEMRKASALYEYRHCFFPLDELIACIPSAQFQRLPNASDVSCNIVPGGSSTPNLYDESKRFCWLGGQQGISPVFSLTASIFFWLVEKGRSKALASTEVTFVDGRFELKTGNHTLVYTTEATGRDALDSLFPPSHQWVSGCVYRDTAQSVPLLLCAAIQMHQRDDVDFAAALDRAEAVLVLLKQLHADTGNGRQVQLLDQAKEEHVFRVYTLLSYFLPAEEDVLYHLAMAFGALSRDAANNLYKPRYDQGLHAFCLPPKLARLHRMLLRGCLLERRRLYVETHSRSKPFTVLPASYYPGGTIPLGTSISITEAFSFALTKMKTSWDTCSDPAEVLLLDSAKDIASIVPASEVHASVLPHMLVFHITNHRARVNIAYALRMSLAGAYGSDMEAAFPELELWKLLTKKENQFRFILGTPIPGVVMTWNASAQSIVLKKAPNAEIAETLRIYMYDTTARVKRAWMDGFSGLLVSIQDVVRIFHTLIHRRILYPLARLLWHDLPVDHLRFLNPRAGREGGSSPEVLTWRQLQQGGLPQHEMEMQIEDIFKKVQEHASLLLKSVIPLSVREAPNRRYIGRKRRQDSEPRAEDDNAGDDDGGDDADDDDEGDEEAEDKAPGIEHVGVKLNILYNLVKGRDRTSLQTYFAYGDKRTKLGELPASLFRPRRVYGEITTNIRTAVDTKGVIVPADVNAAITKIGAVLTDQSKDALAELMSKVMRPLINTESKFANKMREFVLPAMKNIIDNDASGVNMTCGLDTYVDFYNAILKFNREWEGDASLRLAAR
jgi:hypothetical protein